MESVWGYKRLPYKIVRHVGEMKEKGYRVNEQDRANCTRSIWVAEELHSNYATVVSFGQCQFAR